VNLAAAVGAATTAFLERLAPEGVASACLPFDEGARRAWAYWPAPRAGIALARLDRAQVKAAHKLLAALLPLPAFAQAVTIMNLDEVLDRVEGYRGDRRHGLDYSVAVFGRPGDEAWGVRFEGHHVSVHATVAGGEVATTPFFLGANPASVNDEGGRSVSRPLGPEEDVAAALLGRLDEEQRKRAVVSDTAPSDILSGEAPDAGTRAGLGALTGLPATALRPAQVSLLRSLAALYVNRLTRELAEPILAEIDRDLPGFCFAWAGPAVLAPGQPHYYRLEGPRFLVEFDNRQNGANHIHSVWREPGGDFGARLLPEALRPLS